MHGLASSTGILHAVWLTPGQNLTEALRGVFVASGAEAMAVVSCVGSLTDGRSVTPTSPAALPIPAISRSHYYSAHWMRGGQHLHLTIADDAVRAFGGHLMPLGSAVYTTAEIVVLALSGLVFDRQPCALSDHDELVVTLRGVNNDTDAR